MTIKNLINSYIEEQKNWGLEYYYMPSPKKNAVAETSTDREKMLKDLFDKIKDCRKCPLGKTRIKFVFGVGNVYSKLVFVGEAPGYDEDHKGEPFVGRAGQLLNKIIEAMNLKREDVYIANITKCHPMIDPTNPEKRGNDRPPTREEMAECMPYLEKQLEIIRPEVICALGKTAAQGLLNTEETIGNLRGRVLDLKIGSLDIKIVPTYHPAALLRNPSLKKHAWEDIKLVMKLLKKGKGEV